MKSQYALSQWIVLGAVVVGFSGMIGCAGRASVFPNPDPTLRKTSAQFAADAARRHPYPSQAPRGGEAAARSQVGYTMNRLEIVNLSDENWSDIEVWVNEKYVVSVPKMPRNQLKRLNFQMLYDEKGNYFPINNMKTRVTKVEIYRDGKMYDVPLRLAD